MKNPLRTILDRLHSVFESSRVLRPFLCVLDATDAFFFSPAATAPGAPHVRSALDLKRYMALVIVAAAPALGASIYFFGLHVLAMIAVSYAVGGAVEVLFAVVRREEITEGFLVTGLLFPLALPPATPLWVVAVSIAFGVTFGKEVFGGTGRNVFNPALVARCFAAIAYPTQLTTGWIVPATAWPGRLFQYVDASAPDALTAATPLVAAKQGTYGALAPLLWGNVPGSAGETSALLIALGGILLCITRVANWRIPASIVGTTFLSAAVLHALWPAKFAPAAFQVVAGGLMFGAVFMATDPVTSPATNAARWAYGALIGALTVLIRGLSGYVEGVMFAILLMNVFAPLLDEVVVQIRCRRYAIAR